MRRSVLASCVFALALCASAVQAQPVRPAPPYTLISRDGRRAVQAATWGEQDMLRAEELTALFQLSFREDRASNSLTASRGGRTVVLSLDQGLASVGGRLVSLAAPPVRDGKRWVVPADFVSRALPLIVDTKIELRRASRLILVGDVRVPRVGVRLEQAGTATRVLLDLNPGAPYAVAQEPRRLLIRVDADTLDPSGASFGGQGLVESVITADPTTVVVSLAPGFGSFRASAVAADPGSTRIQIDVLPFGAPAQAGSPLATATPQAPPRSEPPPGLSQPALPSIRTIAIDPGHGGEDTGARGAGGAMEKDITLDVSRRLKSAIESRLGIRVLLTREDDRMVPLDERTAFANNNKADLFISIHVNASPRRDARGAEVFYLSLDGLSAETRRMAENPQGRTLPTIGGGSRDVELILWETAQARHLTESAALSGFIEEELRKSIGMSPRSMQQASFRVLVGANMPAVLVEVGFISNPDQEAQLGTDLYRNQIVQAVYDAILRYRARVAGGRQERQ